MTTQALTTITGRVQALRRAAGMVNLLEDMQKGVFATGLAAAVSGQAGMVANAASPALYDGEEVEHIAVLINGQLAVGTFEWLEDLKVDDEVKLVVSQIEDGPLSLRSSLTNGALVEEIFTTLGVPAASKFKAMPWSLQGLNASKGYNSLSGKQGFVFVHGHNGAAAVVWPQVFGIPQPEKIDLDAPQRV